MNKINYEVNSGQIKLSYSNVESVNTSDKPSTLNYSQLKAL